MGEHADAVDLAVIGAGPCGLAAGIAARRAGVSCTLFDRGCVVSSISSYPTHMTFFSTADRLEIGGVPFVVVGEKPTRREALRYYQRLADEFDLDVRQYEEVTDVAPDEGGRGFRLSTRTATGAGHIYRATHVVVATGYFDSPNLLGIPGEDLPNVRHNYREPHVYFRQRCVVVGGGNSAVDAALELQRWGAAVTIVHFEPALDPNIKPWVRPEIEARLRDGHIAARFAARLAEVRAGSVLIRDEATGAVEELPTDWVLAMTGYTPDGRMLRSLGVAFDPETGIPRHDPETMETNVSGVYIAGVLTAGYNANKVFIENGRGHGERIAAHVSGKVGGARQPVRGKAG
ncbi:MAG TPA: YpdA family putative bacillithiol disulfide reductase [Longimicrobiales bacterium]|nr:YpdA family putative bacillithiol disulfide reductase [Longimicrobiales bacterium]